MTVVPDANGNMIELGLLECHSPKAWPISWRASASSIWLVQVSFLSKLTSPAGGYRADACTPPLALNLGFNSVPPKAARMLPLAGTRVKLKNAGTTACHRVNALKITLVAVPGGRLQFVGSIETVSCPVSQRPPEEPNTWIWSEVTVLSGTSQRVRLDITVTPAGASVSVIPPSVVRLTRMKAGALWRIWNP